VERKSQSTKNEVVIIGPKSNEKKRGFRDIEGLDTYSKRERGVGRKMIGSCLILRKRKYSDRGLHAKETTRGSKKRKLQGWEESL